VILDTAPGLVTYDASDLAPEVDSVVLVARAGKTRAAALIQFLDQLAQVESPMLGVVLVGTKPKVSLPRRPRRLGRRQSARRAPERRVSKSTRKTAESQHVGATLGTQDAAGTGGGNSSPDVAPTVGATATDQQGEAAKDGGPVAEDTNARSEHASVEATAKP